MSLGLNQFQTYSPSYENISSRMNRLKQHKHTSSASQIRPNSFNRKMDINIFSVQPIDTSTYKPRRRLSPTAIMLNEEVCPTDKFTGRVAKNTGLKKYNQRQMKEALDGKHQINLKTEGSTLSSGRFNLPTCPTDVANPSPYKYVRGYNEIKQKEILVTSAVRKDISWEGKLIPGRIYTKQELQNWL